MLDKGLGSRFGEAQGTPRQPLLERLQQELAEDQQLAGSPPPHVWQEGQREHSLPYCRLS